MIFAVVIFFGGGAGFTGHRGPGSPYGEGGGCVPLGLFVSFVGVTGLIFSSTVQHLPIGQFLILGGPL